MIVRSQIRVAWVALLGVVLAGCATFSHRGEETNGPAVATVDVLRIEAQARYAAGLAYDLNLKPQEAAEEYYRAALADPAFEPVVLESARRSLRAKNNARAIEVLKKAAAEPESTGTILAWLGLAYAQAGRTNEAISANQAAIRKMPGILVPYQNLAQLHLQTGHTNRALKALDSASRQKAKEPAFFIDLSELYLRFARIQTNKADHARAKARAALDRAAQLKPENLFVRQKLAEAYLALGDLPKAAGVYAQMIQANPAIAALRAKLAEIYLRSGENEKAAKELEAIASADPTNPQTHFFLGALALEQKQMDKAVEAFERAILLNPDLEPAYYELAIAQLNLEKVNEAWSTLEKARGRFKLNFIIEFYSGLVQSTLKNYTAALTHLVSAEILAKASEPTRLNHRFYFQLGATHERAGDHAEAAKQFLKSIEMEPDFAEALNYLGYMWVDAGTNLVEAKVMIEKAVKLEPENAAFLDSLAWAYYKLKQPRDALTWQLKAIQHAEKPDATLLEHLGDIHADLNQFDQARDAWDKSLKIEANPKVQSKRDAAAQGRRATP